METAKYFEEEPEHLEKEEALDLLREVGREWKKEIPIFLIKKEAKEIYQGYDKKTAEQLRGEFEDRLKKIVDERIEEIIKESPVLLFYKDYFSWERFYRTAKESIVADSSNEQIKEKMLEEMRREYNDDMAKDFLEPLLTQYIKHDLKMSGEELKRVRRETIEYIFGNIDKTLYHSSIINDGHLLQKKCLDFLKKYQS